jgi:hypothetical protein
MQIKFSVNYIYSAYDSKNECFQATVSALIPNSELYSGKIGDYTIFNDSDSSQINLKKISVKFSAGSFEEVKKKVENAIESYKRQVLKNAEILKKIKDYKKEIILDFPNPINPVKISIRCYYCPSKEEKAYVWAVLSALIPKEPNKNYISPCYFGNINTQEIGYNSGEDEGNFRKIETVFYADSLENIDKKIESIIENYRKQVLLNIEMQKHKEIIIDLPDTV